MYMYVCCTYKREREGIYLHLGSPFAYTPRACARAREQINQIDGKVSVSLYAKQGNEIKKINKYEK